MLFDIGFGQPQPYFAVIESCKDQDYNTEKMAPWSQSYDFLIYIYKASVFTSDKKYLSFLFQSIYL
jgi:hypothetical protein